MWIHIVAFKAINAFGRGIVDFALSSGWGSRKANAPKKGSEKMKQQKDKLQKVKQQKAKSQKPKS